MLFVEFRFFIFFTAVFAITWLLKSNGQRKAFLLAASYVFYGAWDWRFLSLIIFSTLVDYILARRIEATQPDRKRKQYLTLSIITNLGMLGFFKYFGFFTDSFVVFSDMMGFSVNRVTLDIVLPVGISFYTFQTMSYTIDVYRRKIAAEKSLLDVGFYVAFFPQLVAGPIVRAIDFLPQLARKREIKDVAFKALILLFIIGFIKKACISDNIAPYVDMVFEDPQAYSALSIRVAIMLYAAQIYCDFSGYTDMAIACAGLLGYHLPRNFNAPYLATSIIDFWHRWHISLSTWLRDYLYIPLGGNRYGSWHRYRNIMITMLLGGLWHGAAWTFVIWGGLHGIALSANHLWNERVGKSLGIIAGWFLTICIVCLCWIFFRSDTLSEALYLSGVYLMGDAKGADNFKALIIALPAILFFVHLVWYKYKLEDYFSKVNNLLFSVLIGLLIALAVAFIPTGYKPFIYFQF